MGYRNPNRTNQNRTSKGFIENPKPKTKTKKNFKILEIVLMVKAGSIATYYPSPITYSRINVAKANR
jgi:hypothetical protein